MSYFNVNIVKIRNIYIVHCWLQ